MYVFISSSICKCDQAQFSAYRIWDWGKVNIFHVLISRSYRLAKAVSDISGLGISMRCLKIERFSQGKTVSIRKLVVLHKNICCSIPPPSAAIHPFPLPLSPIYTEPPCWLPPSHNSGHNAFAVAASTNNCLCQMVLASVCCTTASHFSLIPFHLIKSRPTHFCLVTTPCCSPASSTSTAR